MTGKADYNGGIAREDSRVIWRVNVWLQHGRGQEKEKRDRIMGGSGGRQGKGGRNVNLWRLMRGVAGVTRHNSLLWTPLVTRLRQVLA